MKEPEPRVTPRHCGERWAPVAGVCIKIAVGAVPSTMCYFSVQKRQNAPDVPRCHRAFLPSAGAGAAEPGTHLRPGPAPRVPLAAGTGSLLAFPR